MKPCDNRNNVHDNIIINQQEDGIRTRCKICGQINVIRIGFDGRMDNRKYAKIFKRDIAQEGSNVYYRINQSKMSIA